MPPFGHSQVNFLAQNFQQKESQPLISSKLRILQNSVHKTPAMEGPKIENVAQVDASSDTSGWYTLKPGARTIILMIAVVSCYFASLIHLVGSGFLGRAIVASVGGSEQTVWLTSILTLELVVLGPPVSQAADYWGRKWLIVCLTSMGTIGCIIGSRSNSIGMILGAQAVAGLAQVPQPLLHAVTSEVIAREHRPLAQIFNNIAAGLGGILALLVGGSLTLHNPDGWRTYWYLTAAIYAVAALSVALLYNPPPRDLQRTLSHSQKIRSLDWGSFILLTVSLTLFCIALSWSQNPYPWTNAHVIAPFAASIGAIMGLVLYSTFVKKDGLFHHGLFSRSRNFAMALVCIFCEGLAFFASNNYFSFQMATLYGDNQFRAGLAYCVGFFSYIVFTTMAGIYCSRQKRVRLPLMVAFAVFTLYYGLMASTNVSTSERPWGYVVLLGLGLGIALNALIVVAQLSTPPELISTATGLMISTRSLGGTVGLSIYNAVFNSAISANLAKKVFAATIPLGAPKSSVGPLIGALTEGKIAAAEKLAGITPAIISAAGLAVRLAFALAFRNVWITAASFTVFALCVSAFVIDPEQEFTAHIDAPIFVDQMENPIGAAHSEAADGKDTRHPHDETKY